MSTNVRVENRKTSGSFEEKREGFRDTLKAFRRACIQSGVMNEWRRREFYEKPSDKNRRKKKERTAERNKMKKEGTWK